MSSNLRLYDTHCHFERADAVEIAAILARAKAAGVEKLMAVGGSPALNESAGLAVEVAADLFLSPKAVCALGYDREQVQSGEARSYALGEKSSAGHLNEDHGADPSQAAGKPLPHCNPLALPLSAIGEIGLDYHYSPETREAQRALFAAQLEEARARDLPVVIHTREAADDTIALLKEIPSRGIVHCFTGDPDEAKAYLDLGFFISFSGIATFKAADNVRASVRVVPDDRILIETDSPFLAPVPMRGQANEPAFIRYTCEFLAKFRNVPAEDFAELTFANAEKILG